MATLIPTAKAGGNAQTTPEGATSTLMVPPYTPTHHCSVSTLKPIRLLSLTSGERCKSAVFEFDGGFQRAIDLVTPQDAWHSLFSDLSPSDANKLKRHGAMKTLMPDGTVKLHRGPLSFMSSQETKRGRYLGRNDFDVTANPTYRGSVDGLQAMLELFRYIVASNNHFHSRLIARSVLMGAAKAYLEGGAKPPSASAFLYAVADFLVFETRHVDFERYLGERIRTTIEDGEHMEKVYAEEDAKRVKHMNAARRAKRAALQECCP